MYQIVTDEVAAFNGLGENGALWNSWGKDLVKIGVDAGTKIAQTAINAKNNQNPNPATTYTGGNTYTPVVYQPTTTPPATTTGNENKTDWMPWIIGGAIAVAGIYLITRK